MLGETPLESTAYPKLGDEQLGRIARCSKAIPRHFRAGEVLFRAGDVRLGFFVIAKGEVAIKDAGSVKDGVLATLEAGHFTGEVADISGAPALVSTVALTDADAYEITPEVLHKIVAQCPDLGDVILRAFLARRQLLRTCPLFQGLRVVGSRFSHDTFRIRDFLSRNRIPFVWLDLESEPHLHELLATFGVSEDETPIVAFSSTRLLRNPSNAELAGVLGLHQALDDGVYDLVIVGGGPSGLAAAVYASSEGLKSLVLERSAPGGQAGISMRIENYLGFPAGITGSELADRAVLQAEKFGAALSVPSAVERLDFDELYPVLELDDGSRVTTRALLIATGAEYRRLNVPGCTEFEGTGVYYAATQNEAALCRGRDVIVVGGGNSAGQASVFLAGQARRVHHLIRGADLYKSMSSYLAKRIEQTENIEVSTQTVVLSMRGDTELRTVEIENTQSGERRSLDVAALFCFIGAVPHTGWLSGAIDTDSHGFVRTGLSVPTEPGEVRRDPFLLETNHRGVFAAGDVRSGSIKRVASAVGEGAMAVQFVHEHFKHA
jgi:thioredoxin reductase (NADPH)